MKKIISLLLALTMVIGLIPGVFAAEGDHYLALGDSITGGSGLKAGQPAFPEILAENNGWVLTNMGTDGQTAGSLLKQLNTGSCDEAIKKAEFITITTGGNDVMDALYELVAQSYNVSFDPDITADDVVPILSNSSDSRWFMLLMVAVTIINGDEEAGVPPFAERKEFLDKIDECVANLKKVNAYIKKLNPKANVIIATQYNPYKSFSGMYEIVGTSVNEGAKKLNAAIAANAKSCGYLVADVFTVFDNSTETLCNATTSPMNLDFHPNARGHEVIAEVMQEIVNDCAVKYLALGDSITAGIGLGIGEPAFPEILAETNEWVLTNAAADGMTSAKLLELVKSGELDESIEAAGVITITVGGYDMMALLYKMVVDSYNAAHDPDITANDVIPIMNNSEDSRWFNLAIATLGVLNGNAENGIPAFPERKEFSDSIKAFTANLKGIMSYIRKLNADVTVIVPTQYNPYQDFTGMFEIIAGTVNSGAAKLNDAIKSCGKANGFDVVDVHATFKGSDETLCNATSNPLNMDFHPNARGHEVIAELIQKYMDNPFSDVPADQFYFEPVQWAVENGVTTGASATTFNPGGECLRAQVVTFLWRAAGQPEPTSNVNPFTDVKETDFFYKPVLWAVENGITNGVSATEFGAYAVCNRAAVVTFLWRAAGEPMPPATEHPFTDVPAGSFYESAVLWAVENGITNGTSATTFGPTANCNRAQVVTFLYRAQ